MSSGKHRSRAKVAKTGGDHDIEECGHMLHGQYIHYKPQHHTEGRELVTVYNNDGDRVLVVPSRDAIETPGIVSVSEFERLKRQAIVVTKQERLRLMAEAEQHKIKLAEESQSRKDFLNKVQMQQKSQPGTKLGDVEEEAATKNAYTLQRAHELRQEQEEDVRKLNSVILATKCMAIREAQLAEKKLIREEQDEEERRLDTMMEQRRQLAIKRENDKKEDERGRTKKFVKEVRQQIKENEMARLVEAEKVEQEGQVFQKKLLEMQREDVEKERKRLEDIQRVQEEMIESNKNMERYKVLRQEEDRIAEMRSQVFQKRLLEMQREDVEKERKRLEDIQRVQEEMIESNKNMERYKALRQEEDRIAEMRIKEFMRIKAEREEAREFEQKAIREAKQREIARLRSLQQQAHDQKAFIDDVNYRRERERVDKEWREKEKLAAQKRKQQANDLRRDRGKQIDDLRRTQALELARDEAEFHTVAQAQRQLFEKDKEQKARKKEEANQHRKELLRQINDKERDRINVHQRRFKEGEALRLEHELRDIKIKETIQKKMSQLREINVPEQYIADIQRQVGMKNKV